MKTISVAALKDKLDAGEKLNLIDVREPHENAEFNIGGKLFPLGQVQMMQLDDIEDLKDEAVFCYCRSGKRSAQACLILETAGFTDVTNVEGGMLAWQEAFTAAK